MDQPNRNWVADFTNVWAIEEWLFVVAVIILFAQQILDDGDNSVARY